MITNSIAHDVLRIVQSEAESALPNAPYREDRARSLRSRRIASIRLHVTHALRRVADAIEPVQPEPARQTGC